MRPSNESCIAKMGSSVTLIGAVGVGLPSCEIKPGRALRRKMITPKTVIA
jgi:hypothetical protein